MKWIVPGIKNEKLPPPLYRVVLSKGFFLMKKKKKRRKERERKEGEMAWQNKRKIPFFRLTAVEILAHRSEENTIIIRD